MSEQVSHSKPEGIRPALLVALVVVLSMAPFLLAVGGEWILDDGPLIASNRYIHDVSWWTRWFTGDFWDVDVGEAVFLERLRYFRPLVTASYALDWAWGGGSQVAFHVTNVLMHGVVGWLVYRLLRRWVGSPVAAACGALVFALHPTRVEAVAWISGRTDVLCVAFMLVAVEGLALRLRGSRWGVGLEIGGVALAFLTKEQAVVLPLLVGVEAWIAAGRPALGKRSLIGIARAAAPYVVVVLAYLVARQLLLPFRTFEVAGLPFGKHVLVVAETLGRYGLLVVWPSNLSMSQALVRTNDQGLVVSGGYAIAGVLVVAGLVGVAVWQRTRRPEISLALGLFLATLMPVSNVVWAGFMTLISPRFLYLPLLGVAWLVAQGVVAAGSRRKPVLLGAMALVAVFGVTSALRSQDFVTRDAYWSYELSKTPDYLEAMHYFIRKDLARGRPSAALVRAKEAHSIATRSFSHTGRQADFALIAVEILVKLTRDEDKRSSGAILRFCEAILEGKEAVARLVVPLLTLEVRTREGKTGAGLVARLPRLESLAAEMSSRQGLDARAVEHAEACVQMCPFCDKAVLRSALALARARRFDQADAALDRIADYRGRGAVSAERGRVKAARDAWEEAERVGFPMKAQLRARCYGVLGAWGRAYAELRDHRGPIEAAGPEAARAFAEVAWRAGDEKVATEVLARHASAEATAAMTGQWSLAMLWVDAPGEK